MKCNRLYMAPKKHYIRNNFKVFYIKNTHQQLIKLRGLFKNKNPVTEQYHTQEFKIFNMNSMLH